MVARSLSTDKNRKKTPSDKTFFTKFIFCKSLFIIFSSSTTLSDVTMMHFEPKEPEAAEITHDVALKFSR